MEKEFRVYFGGANRAIPSSSSRLKRASVVNATQVSKTNPIKQFYDFAVGRAVLSSNSNTLTGYDKVNAPVALSTDSPTKKGRRRSTWEKPAEFILGVEVSRRGSTTNSNHVGMKGDENCDNYGTDNTDNTDNNIYAEDFEYCDDDDGNDINDDQYAVVLSPSSSKSFTASTKCLLNTPSKSSISVDPPIDDSPSWFKALKEENIDHLNGRRISQTSSASSSGSKPLWLSAAQVETSLISLEHPQEDYLTSLTMNKSLEIPRPPVKSTHNMKADSVSPISDNSKSCRSPGVDGSKKKRQSNIAETVETVNNTLATLASILDNTTKPLPSLTLRRLVQSPPKNFGDNVDDLLSELSLLHISVDASEFKRQPIFEEIQTLSSARETYLYRNFLSTCDSIATVRCKSITLVLHSSWGSDDYIALDGVSFLDYLLNSVQVASVVTNVECDVGLFKKSRVENLLEGKCWMAPIQSSNISLKFTFSVEVEIAAVKVTNYNNTCDKSALARGVKVLHVSADGISLGNAIVRRATGLEDKDTYDNSQLLLLDSLAIGDENSVFNNRNKAKKYKSIAYNQEYEVCNMPCGMLFKFVLVNNHGIDNFVAFDSIHFYDQDCVLIPANNNCANLMKISAYPRLQKPCSFFFPFQIETNGTLENQKQVLVMFNTPKYISAIKIVNNNCCDYSLHLDDNLLFMGSMAKKESKFIVFSNSFLENFKDETVTNIIYEQEVTFINDRKFMM